MFFKKKKTKEAIMESEVCEFNNIMSNANLILNGENPNRIYEVIYSLGKPYQFQLINNLLKGNPLDRDIAFNVEHLFFKNSNKNYTLSLSDINGDLINYKAHSNDQLIHPTDTLIFTFPWNSKRLINAFKTIGSKVDVRWKHDDLNHRVTYISPLNIGYIYGGNHSTVINIINNEAPMKIKEELNIAPVYKEIYTDGKYYYRMDNKQLLDEVSSVEFAAIFEIGRLILEKNLSQPNLQ